MQSDDLEKIRDIQAKLEGRRKEYWCKLPLQLIALILIGVGIWLILLGEAADVDYAFDHPCVPSVENSNANATCVMEEQTRGKTTFTYATCYSPNTGCCAAGYPLSVSNIILDTCNAGTQAPSEVSYIIGLILVIVGGLMWGYSLTVIIAYCDIKSRYESELQALDNQATTKGEAPVADDGGTAKADDVRLELDDLVFHQRK
jgi:hypothetical protein